jgi:hypothetical protein
LEGTSASWHWKEAFVEALNDKGQQQMAGVWPTWLDPRAAQQEAPEEPNVRATQQEAPKEREVEEEGNDQP